MKDRQLNRGTGERQLGTQRHREGGRDKGSQNSELCTFTQRGLSPFSPPDLVRRVDSPALSGRGSRPSGRTSG